MSEPFDGIKNGLQDVLEITKKDKMLELADRCEKGDVTASNIYMAGFDSNCIGSLDAVSAIESVRLHDNCDFHINKDGGVFHVMWIEYLIGPKGSYGRKLAEATAPTEPLARLAALLRALAEKEGE